jgi:hypothetical protein
MAGHKKHSGKQEEIHFTNRLKAYVQVAQELGRLGISPRYVGDIWLLRIHSSTRRYQEDPNTFLLKSYMHGLVS